MNNFIFKPTAPLSWNQVLLEGPDAKDFLERLTTLSIKNLSPGGGQNGCFLSASGKIQAYFKLWCHSPTEYIFEFDAGRDHIWKDKLHSTIDHYTFSEKMTLHKDFSESLACYWIFLGDTDLLTLKDNLNLSTHHTFFETKNKSRFYFQRKNEFSKNWITAWGSQEILEQEIESLFKLNDGTILQTSFWQTLSWPTLNKWRIESLTPWVGAEILLESNPLEIGLSHAIAHHKGCYPGQEVMERIRSMGAPPKRLVQVTTRPFCAQTAPPPGTKIYTLTTPPIEVGVVTTSTLNTEGFLALAIIRKTHANEGTRLQIGDEHTESQEATIQKLAHYE